MAHTVDMGTALTHPALLRVGVATQRTRIAALVAMALVLGACGDASVEPDEAPDSTASSTSTTVAVVTATVPPPPTTTTSTTSTTTTTVPLLERLGVEPAPAYTTIENPAGPGPMVLPPEPPAFRLEPLPGTLALTFDDGPDPKWTPIILDILKERGATATFFVLGWKVDAYPELARRIVDEGHSLQSHAYRHHNLTNRSDAAVIKLIDDTATAIFNATGTTPVCIRPPAGITSRRLIATAAARGHFVVLWDSVGNSLDYSIQSTSGVIRRAAAWQAGDVTLMHDTWGAIYDDGLPVILDDLEARGIGTSTICVTDAVAAPTPPAN